MPAASRLIVVSNRAPVEMVRGPEGLRAVRTVGGLAGALDDALRAHGGLWIAWVGVEAGDELPAGTAGLPYPIRTVRLKEREVNNYYAGFANQGLWPLCHAFPSRCRFQANYWAAYRHANERFAAAVQAVVRPRDLVWLHDFHLCLVPGLLRAAGVPASVGVFWHIPFPPPTVFGICRWRAELLSREGRVDVLERRVPLGREASDDPANRLVDRSLHVTVVGQAVTRGYRDLHQADASAPLGAALEEALVATQPLENPLGVVEAIDPEHDHLGAKRGA